MKKGRLLFLLIFCLVFLGACGNNDTAGTDEKDTEKKQAPKQGEFVDGPLTKVGQKNKGEHNEIYELKNIKVVDETTDLDPLSINIKDVKILSISNISDDLLESYQQGLKLKLKNPVNYIQISFSAENKGKIDLLWPQISHVILNTKEQVNAKENQILDSGEWELYSGAKKDITQGIPFESDPKDSSVGNGTPVTHEKKIKVKF